nr:hypothetical protein [Mesorhizobium sp.]
MNNQFSGPTAWHDYLTALEQATPVIEAIAVTDYCVTDTYEELLRQKAAGRLSAAKLIFPNVELRLDVATAKGGFVNLHLFVSPEDPQHIEELRRLLSRLRFNVMQDHFDCIRADLIRLGKKADPAITDDRAALSYGANQFKVTFQQLRDLFTGNGWAKKNILTAVAGGATDGTSGVREAADQTIRREIEGFADVIFVAPVQAGFQPAIACPNLLGAEVPQAEPKLPLRRAAGGPQARRCGVTVRGPLLVDQRGAGVRRSSASMHRPQRPRACRRRAARVGHAVAGDLGSPRARRPG